MASEKMEWIAELFDKMSGPAKRIRLGLQGMQTSLDKSSLAAKGTNSSFLMLGAGLGGWAQVAQTAWGAAKTLGSAIFGLGESIGVAAFKQFAFKESALATGKALWGSTEAAEAMFKQASDLARLTPFNVGDVVKSFNKLGAAGFGADEVPVVFQGLADIASMSGRGAEAIDSITLAFSQIMGRGKLASQELNQITEAAGGAVSRLKLFGEIARIMKVDQSAIESMMENGLIPARTAILGVMNVAKNLGGGVLGANAVEQSKTLGGLWSNLEDTVTNLWLTMDLTKKPWFAAVKNFLSGLVTALDTTSVAGAEVQAVFDRLFGRTIGRFIGNGKDDPTDRIIELAHAFEGMANIAIAAFDGLRKGLMAGFAPLLQGAGLLEEGGLTAQGAEKIFFMLGQTIGDLALGIGTLSVALTNLVHPLDWVGRSAKGLWNGLTNITEGAVTFDGSQISRGLDQLMGNDTYEIGATMGENLATGFADTTQIRSPSRVFEGFGENIVEGFNRGVSNIAGMDATLGADLAAGASQKGGGGAGAGGVVNVTLNVNMQATDGIGSEATAHRFAQLALAELTGAFDKIATEGGVV